MFDAPDRNAQHSISADMQRLLRKRVPYIPLGQARGTTAFRSNVTGVVTGFPVFWNLRKD